MYVREMVGGSVLFPYNLDQLRADFPRTCFPPASMISNDALAEFGVYPCTASNQKPEDTDVGTARRSAPVKAANGQWTFAWQIVADSPDMLLVKFDQLVDRIKSRIDNDYINGVDTLNAGADLYEMLSWPAQLNEAQKLQNNANAAAPIITALATFKGVTKLEYAQTVISNAQDYNVAYGPLLATKKAKMRQVKNIVNSADTLEVKVAALRAV